MKRNRSHIVDALARLLVQRLDVAKGMSKTQSRHAHLIRSETVKHERIVGIRAVRDADFPHLRGRIAGVFRFLFGNCGHD